MQEALFRRKNKRRYVRIDTILSVRLKTNDGSVETIYEGTTNNISEGGLCMKVEENIDELLTNLAVDDFAFNVSIQLLKPDEAIEVDAVGRWTSSRIEWVKMPPYKRKVLNVGLAFRDVPEATRNLIQHHIQNRLKKKSDSSDSS